MGAPISAASRPSQRPTAIWSEATIRDGDRHLTLDADTFYQPWSPVVSQNPSSAESCERPITRDRFESYTAPHLAGSGIPSAVSQKRTFLRVLVTGPSLHPAARSLLRSLTTPPRSWRVTLQAGRHMIRRTLAPSGHASVPRGSARQARPWSAPKSALHRGAITAARQAARTNRQPEPRSPAVPRQDRGTAGELWTTARSK